MSEARKAVTEFGDTINARPGGNLLWFNLKTDAVDDVLGFTTDWITVFSGRFDRIIVVTMQSGEIQVPPNVEVFSLGKEVGYSEARRLLRFYQLLARIFSTHRVDGCFAHMTPLFAVLAFPLLWAKRIPLTLWYAHKSVTATLRLAEKVVDRIVTPSKESFRIPSTKVEVVGHGINTDRFTPNPRRRQDRSFQIVSVGRLSRIKRIDTLLTAFAGAVQDNPSANMRLILVGRPATSDDHQYVADLGKLIRRLDIVDQVQIHGDVPYQRVAEYYQAADCFVNLSDTGSVDKAVLEAMCCGIPVITSNEAFATILGDLGSGICFVDKSVESVRGAIHALLAMQPTERASLGMQLRERAAKDHGLVRLADLLAARITRPA